VASEVQNNKCRINNVGYVNVNVGNILGSWREFVFGHNAQQHAYTEVEIYLP